MKFLKPQLLQKFSIPFHFRKFYDEYKDKEFTLLDIGCGNHSPRRTKRWFNNCLYYGLDREIYKNNKEDFDLMEEYYEIDLTKGKSSLEIIPNDFFDVLILSHIIEHLRNGLEIIDELTKKIKEGGKIYIEFPSVKSLSLPSFNGTLNFCDDPTHIRVYCLEDIANVLLSGGMKIIKGGTRRDYISMIRMPLDGFRAYRKDKMLSATLFWDLTGFASYIYAEKRVK